MKVMIFAPAENMAIHFRSGICVIEETVVRAWGVVDIFKSIPS